MTGIASFTEGTNVAVSGSDIVIRNLGSGKVLEVAPRRETAKISQSLQENSGNVAQRWRLIPACSTNHEYQIQSIVTGEVLEVIGSSCDDKAYVSLSREEGSGAHQRWRLVPASRRRNEYAIINVNSGKALDLWNGAQCEDTPLVQMGYWHGLQQRWILNTCGLGMSSRAVFTIVRNENIFLPIWLRYYGQFFSARDIYVLDHQSTDGSTRRDGFTRIPVSNPVFGASWQRDVVQEYQHELLERYDVVLYTDVDEIVAPDPRLGDLGSYIDHFTEDFITCQGYEVLHQKDYEPPLDPSSPVLRQRCTWYPNSLYSKPLLARVPMLWQAGFHVRADGRIHNDPNLYLVHLHRMDYEICLTRHLDRSRFPLAQVDADLDWGYQNRITALSEFSAWFYRDSCGPSPISPQPIPSWWQDLV